MHVSIGQIAVEKKLDRQMEFDVMQCDMSRCQSLNVSASKTYCAKSFVAPASQVPVKIVFVFVLLFLISEHPIQRLFWIHLVSVIKMSKMLDKLLTCMNG